MSTLSVPSIVNHSWKNLEIWKGGKKLPALQAPTLINRSRYNTKEYKLHSMLHFTTFTTFESQILHIWKMLLKNAISTGE